MTAAEKTFHPGQRERRAGDYGAGKAGRSSHEARSSGCIWGKGPGVGGKDRVRGSASHRGLKFREVFSKKQKIKF